KAASKLHVGGIPPAKLKWSKGAYFRGKLDYYGAAIAKRSGKKGSYSWNVTNETYAAGYDDFYIFEILGGWARVYSSSNNGWVWHERLRVTEIY
ncbi:MAG: N-acetylmuramoyl-L-alanine amidase, partial [Staphylococcus saprophyticus]